MKNLVLFLVCIASCINGYTQSIQLIKDIRVDDPEIKSPVMSGSNIQNLVVVDQRLFFRASNGTTTNMWTSDGTTDGTQSITHPSGGQVLGPVVKYDNQFYYLQNVASDPNQGNRMLRLDGALQSAETFTNHDVRAIRGVHFNKLFLFVKDPTTGYEIWTTDGTAEGTQLLKDINPNPDATLLSSIHVPRLIEHNGILYFSKDDNGAQPNIELWRTNGTTASTMKVKELNESTTPFMQSSNPSSFFVHNNQLHFITDVPDVGGWELWKTDGTETGTEMIVEIPLTYYQINWPPIYFNGHWYIGAWRTDGTAAGSGYFMQEANIRPLVVFNNRLLYTNNTTNPENEFRLYSTDGSFQNDLVLMEADNEEGFYGGLKIAQADIVNGRVYFLASKYETNYVDYGYLWVSDGTPQGTELLTPGSDLYDYYGGGPLLFSGAPVQGKQFVIANEELYFNGMFDAEIGYELYKMEPLDAPIISVENHLASHFQLKVMPNPTSHFLKLLSEEHAFMTLDVYDTHGVQVMQFQRMENDKEFVMDVSSLSAGVYMLKVCDRKGNIFTQTFMKL